MSLIKSKLFLSTLALSAGSVALSGAASAQNYNGPEETTGPYFSGGYNNFDFDEELGGDANVSAITARAGWQLHPNFGVETDASFGIDDGEFDFDGDEDDFDLDDNEDSDFDDVLAGPGDLGLDYLIGFYGRATLPLSDRFDVSARAGYAFAEIDSTVTTIGGNELVFGGSDDGFAMGASATYDLTESMAIRADYTHYEFDTSNAESLGLNLEFKFGV